MNQNNRSDKRIGHRMGLVLDCTLANRSDSIETQIVDISKMGIGVKTDDTMPFENGSELNIFVPSMDNFRTKAKLIWTKKDLNNKTKLGLKFNYYL